MRYRTKIGTPAQPPPPSVLFHNATLVNIKLNKKFQVSYFSCVILMCNTLLPLRLLYPEVLLNIKI